MPQLLIALLLGILPEFAINWVREGDSQHLRAMVSDYHDELSTCLATGLQVRLRYEFKVCRTRSVWFDACEKTRVAITQIEYEPVSESYVISTDRLADGDSPLVERVATVAQAVRKGSQRDDITAPWLGLPEQREGKVIRARALAECKGVYNETMRRLSYFYPWEWCVPLGSTLVGWTLT